ncbi:N-acetylmuramoyl-L-alanine amidase [Bacillus sp. V59.32b]|uniref:N-acetylmuramoyl-L-alanine amidase n=1 Tax=Bacillus sp. V59.32b TaxID=1758642 RepID=UPI0013598EAF|nr:N-acetylmuramoyl-L-alanine amidase [Bacillus sp. V59.32b]
MIKPTASKAAVASGTKYYVTATTLNIRKSPSTSAARVDSVKKNAAVTLYEKKGSWGRVKTASGKTGWASLSYLTTKAPAAPKPAAKAPAKYYVTATSLNIRKSPSTTAAKVDLVKKNAAVSLYEKKGSWGKVKTASGKTGWASLSYLTTKAPVAPKPAPKPPVTTSSGKSYVVIRTDGVNIRKSASTSAAVVTKVNRGTKLEKISVDNGWVQVKTSTGKTGWVANWLATTAGKGVRGKVIVLDPGHGGTDSGAVGKTHNERSINLSTANELKTLLQNAGAKVIMTRTSNTSRKLELSERVAISHQYKPDVFISIHYNSGGNATGIDTFYDAKYGNEKELATSIQNELIKSTGKKNRGVKPAEFYVVKYNEMPSILVELGFISNPTEEKEIATKAYQQKAARGIYNGLNKYFNL